MLSFISLYKHCWKTQSYAAACGVSDKVLWKMLQDGPHIQKVYLCLDNDEAGRKAAGRITAKLTKKGIPNELLVPDRKDWNEELLHNRKEEAKSKV